MAKKKEKQLYKCNRAKQPRCAGCLHSEPHEKHYEYPDQPCTLWEECHCTIEGVEYFMSTRCVKVK